MNDGTYKTKEKDIDEFEQFCDKHYYRKGVYDQHSEDAKSAS